MTAWIDLTMLLIIVSNLALLGTSRLTTVVRLTACQGLILGGLPAMLEWETLSTHTLPFSLAAMAVKGVIFPWLLHRTLVQVKVRREIDPYLGYGFSMLMGLMGLVLALWLETKLRLPPSAGSGLAFSAGFSAFVSGFLLIVTRHKAITQVVGYLAAENGIFLLGAALAPPGAVWVELCVLLDLFVAVFVMGIAIHHISRAFDSIDVDLFTSIRD